ncbi:MAG: hypothetical protein P9X22_08290 [Candidatus Zapsychrus exili]|nr:hypothetical protein [Candidatus Zapsychrus exili]
MFINANNKNINFSLKIIIYFVVISFLSTCIFPTPSFAQGLLGLPQPGAIVNLSSGFAPAILRGIKIYLDNPLQFDFIVDSGDSKAQEDTLEEESQKLIKYFLSALTIPEDNLWVNLSPYEKDRIIPNALGQTDMGRDMLAQDYLLKQITASLMHPEGEIGRKFWDKLYKKAYQKYGKIDISTDTFNKVWIVPEKAVVYEQGDRAFVVESKLKVMLEEEYLNSGQLAVGSKQKASNVLPTANRQLQTEIIKEIIIPAIEKEVNEGKNFAELRQIYNSIILAHWFKGNLKDAILNKVYSDKSKIKGIDIEDKDVSKKIYSQYVEAFKKGVCNYIKEEYDPATKQIIPKKYFSGGLSWKMDEAMITTTNRSVGRKLAKAIAVGLFVITTGVALLSPDGVIGENIELDHEILMPDISMSQEQILEEFREGFYEYDYSKYVEGEGLGVFPENAEKEKVEDERFPIENLKGPVSVENVKGVMHGFRELLEDNIYREQDSNIKNRIWEHNTKIFKHALELIYSGINGDLVWGDAAVPDVVPLSKLGQMLRSARDGDPRKEEVLKVFSSLNNIYILGEFDNSKSTVFLLHGAGRGANSTFSNIIDEIKGDFNVAAFIYDNYLPIDDISRILKEQMYKFHNEYSPKEYSVIGYSLGTIVYRNFVNKGYHKELSSDVKAYIEIAAPISGSNVAAWTTMPEPSFIYGIINKDARDAYESLSPHSYKMLELFSEKSVASFSREIPNSISIVADGDSHAPPKNSGLKYQKSFFEGYVDRYNNTLNSVKESFIIKGLEDPHTNVSNSEQTLKIIKEALEIDGKEKDKAMVSENKDVRKSRDLKYDSWRDISVDLVEEAKKGNVKTLFVDLDNTMVMPMGFVGSETQKVRSINIFAHNYIVEKINNGEIFDVNTKGGQAMLGWAIGKAQKVVYAQGDKDEERMAKHNFFKMPTHLNADILDTLKNFGVNVVVFTARPKSDGKGRLTRKVLASVGIVEGKTVTRIRFTSGDGTIKANVLEEEVERLLKKNKGLKRDQIYFIDDYIKNIDAAKKKDLGINIIQFPLVEGVNHEDEAWHYAYRTAKSFKNIESNDRYVFEYLVDAYSRLPKFSRQGKKIEGYFKEYFGDKKDYNDVLLKQFKEAIADRRIRNPFKRAILFNFKNKTPHSSDYIIKAIAKQLSNSQSFDKDQAMTTEINETTFKVGYDKDGRLVATLGKEEGFDKFESHTLAGTNFVDIGEIRSILDELGFSHEVNVKSFNSKDIRRDDIYGAI